MEQLAEMISALKKYRPSLKKFDIVFRNDWWKGSDAVQKIVHAEESGVTWWLEHVAPPSLGGIFEDPWSLDLIRQFILQGPPNMSIAG